MEGQAKPSGQSDLDRFTSLYDGSFDYVYGFIYARTGCVAVTEDLLQETYAAAWAAMGRFRNQSTGNTWLVSIARRKIADHYRRAIRREKHEEPAQLAEGTPGGMDLEAILIGSETKDQVAQALAALSPVHRFALVMKYLDGCSVKEIAATLRRTPKAVDGILQRAKVRFTEHYRAIATGGGKDGR